MPQSIGLLDPERLALIPPQYWRQHEFCFHLHDQMVHMLHQYGSSGAHNLVADAFRQAIQGRENEFDGVNVLAWMKERDLAEHYRHHIVSHVVMALTADMLDFLFEALSALERRKFPVGFALLRKPLKENLLYLSWVLTDERDFINRFEKDPYVTLNHLSKEHRIAIFERASNHLATSEMFNAELIWEMIYSKQHPNGFEPMWQRATHLVTSMGDLLKTEDYSLNLVFDDPAEDHYYEFIYSKLPYLLVFCVQVTLEAFNKIQALNKKTYNHLVLTTLGCYEALFSDGRSQHVARMLNSKLGDLLLCSHCETPVKITKRTGPEIYLTEQVDCRKCGLSTQVPLYWLFAKVKLNVIKVEGPD